MKVHLPYQTDYAKIKEIEGESMTTRFHLISFTFDLALFFCKLWLHLRSKKSFTSIRLWNKQSEDFLSFCFPS